MYPKPAHAELKKWREDFFESLSNAEKLAIEAARNLLKRRKVTIADRELADKLSDLTHEEQAACLEIVKRAAGLISHCLMSSLDQAEGPSRVGSLARYWTLRTELFRYPKSGSLGEAARPLRTYLLNTKGDEEPLYRHYTEYQIARGM